jgi:short-subunit dehydrogenase
MKTVVLGSTSCLAKALLPFAAEHSHEMLIHDHLLSSLTQIALSLPAHLKLKVFPCDFLKPQESALIQFEELLVSMGKIDLIILSTGYWYPFSQIKTQSTEEIFESWQVNYFYPMVLLKSMAKHVHERTVLVSWSLEEKLLKQPLWSHVGCPSSAFDLFTEVFSKEMNIKYLKLETGLIASPQTKKIYPSHNFESSKQSWEMIIHNLKQDLGKLIMDQSIQTSTQMPNSSEIEGTFI